MSSNYPPGVTGNEPQISGEWPCDECGGQGYDADEDGKHGCQVCEGKGYLTGEESYYDFMYVCSSCAEPQVEWDDLSDTFSCGECGTTFTNSQIAYGDLDKVPPRPSDKSGGGYEAGRYYDEDGSVEPHV